MYANGADGPVRPAAVSIIGEVDLFQAHVTSCRIQFETPSPKRRRQEPPLAPKSKAQNGGAFSTASHLRRCGCTPGGALPKPRFAGCWRCEAAFCATHCLARCSGPSRYTARLSGSACCGKRSHHACCRSCSCEGRRALGAADSSANGIRACTVAGFASRWL